MAEEFGAAYQSLPWAAVFCSPLRRSRDTARPLCDAVGLEMQLRDGLYGGYQLKGGRYQTCLCTGIPSSRASSSEKAKGLGNFL